MGNDGSLSLSQICIANGNRQKIVEFLQSTIISTIALIPDCRFGIRQLFVTRHALKCVININHEMSKGTRLSSRKYNLRSLCIRYALLRTTLRRVVAVVFLLYLRPWLRTQNRNQM